MSNSKILKSPLARFGKSRTLSALLMATAMLAACQSEPTGQVAAIVDGDEITLAQINAELAMMQVAEGSDQKAMQALALQRVVDRRLLANSARQDGIDQTPEFIVRRQQLEEALMVQLLTQKVGRSVKVPTEEEISRYIAANPNMFANRSILTVDQFRFPAPANGEYLKPLAAAKTMAEVRATLEKLGIKVAEPKRTQIDTAQLPGEMVDQIRKVPAGEPFVVPADGMVIVNLVISQQSEPMPSEAVRPAALAAVRNQALSDLLQKRIAAEKAQSEIKYQPGFAPPKKKAN
jgi:peptidyl-prolyl cis-trans isomerase C